MKLQRNKIFLLKLFGGFVLLVTFIFYFSIDTLVRNGWKMLAYKRGHRSRLSALSFNYSGKFFVNTKNCRIPWVDPFGFHIKRIFKPQKYENCSEDNALIISRFNETKRRYILSINQQDAEKVSCCYQQVQRELEEHADNDYRLLPCIEFNDNFTVPQCIDAMIVTCKSKNTNTTIQTDAFSFIQDRSAILEVNNTNDHFRRPNVLLFGIDSLSSINLRRNMPKTATFLRENNWYELEGYNKVGKNSFQNLMPLLTGFNKSTVNLKCNPKEVGGLDNCYFVWDKFKSNGYKTAYAEDILKLSTFNCESKGFEQTPTDYYLRPLILAIENNMQIKLKNRLPFCIGRRHAVDYVYDFGIEFAKRHHKNPGFGLFWTNSFGQNDFTTLSMDLKVLEYLNKMKRDGIFETSIVLFLSDHGTRWNPLLNLPEAFVEERLPMFFMSLPSWLCDEYPEYVKALKINKNRLTTPFDIHQTLKHILNLRKTEEIRSEFSCAAAQSVFHEIPENRACRDACIPEHSCACLFRKYLSTTNPIVRKVTNLIIDEINNYLKVNNFSLCRPLKLKSIIKAQIKTNVGENFDNDTFYIKFFVHPKEAQFKATALYDLKRNKVKVDLEDINRLKLYKPYTKCIQDKLAKKFCICANE